MVYGRWFMDDEEANGVIHHEPLPIDHHPFFHSCFSFF